MIKNALCEIEKLGSLKDIILRSCEPKVVERQLVKEVLYSIPLQKKNLPREIYAFSNDIFIKIKYSFLL